MQNNTECDLTIEFVRSVLNYDRLTGILTWKTRPRYLFKSFKSYRVWNARYAGKRAGNVIDRDYREIAVLNVKYAEHRLVWFYVYGVWPRYGVDHKDGDPSNNKIDNLRAATQRQNLQNQGLKTTNTSGYTGVSWAGDIRKKWEAGITNNYKQIFLGYFDTKEQAYDAYLAAKAKFHTFNPIPRVAMEEAATFKHKVTSVADQYGLS